MDNKSSSTGWILVIGILIILSASAIAVIWLMYTSVQRTLEPVQSVGGELGTAVAEALRPSPTVLPDPITIIRDVRSLARLETVQYTVEKVITAETRQGTFGALFGDKLIFVAHGRVIAGLDLSKVGADDLVVRSGVLYVTLPQPEIFIAALDNEKSYVYDRNTGLLTKGDINLESAARRVAEDEIKKAAVDDGALELARQNAENYLSRLLVGLGYPAVIFEYDPLPPTAVPTPSS